MNKMQFYITKSLNGYKVLFNINPSEEVTVHVRELRPLLSKIQYQTTEKNIFYFVSTIDTGTFVTIIRTIPGGPDDHLAAWIYIPNELVVTGEELENVVRVASRKVSGDSVKQDDVTCLRELFATEYPLDSEAPVITASNRHGGVAWRRYDGETDIHLVDLLGAGLFQQSYLDYAGVLFVDDDLGVTVDGDDLTDQLIAEQAVILPAPNTPENFAAWVFGHALERPTRASLNAEVDVVWRRQGFEDVVSRQVINADEFVPEAPETSGARKEISASSFYITAQTGNGQLSDCQILVNGYDVTAQPRMFTESELVSASVVINCEGCAPYAAHINLAASTRALVRLQERTKVYNFEIPVKSAVIGSPVRFKIFTKKGLTSSPIEGYEALDQIQEGDARINHLGYIRSMTVLKQKLIFGGVGLLVGILLTFGITKCGSSQPAPVVTPVDSTQTVQKLTSTASKAPTPSATPAASATSAPKTKTTTTTKTEAAKPAPAQNVAVNNVAASEAAIAYLDGHEKWNRDEMKKFPELAGLFDDMNNFRYDKLLGPWAEKLKSSKRYARVVTAVRQGRHKASTPKSDSQTYVPADDPVITVTSYRYLVDK